MLYMVVACNIHHIQGEACRVDARLVPNILGSEMMCVCKCWILFSIKNTRRSLAPPGSTSLTPYILLGRPPGVDPAGPPQRQQLKLCCSFGARPDIQLSRF